MIGSRKINELFKALTDVPNPIKSLSPNCKDAMVGLLFRCGTIDQVQLRVYFLSKCQRITCHVRN